MKKKKLMCTAVSLTVSLGMLLTGCSGTASNDADKTAQDGNNIVFQTYGMPDDWANWQGAFDEFCNENSISRTDTDMSSSEEIQKLLAEKNNPVCNVTDIGMMWGSVAVEQGVCLNYKNENWDSIGDWAKDKDGNWFGTYVGVPVILVNKDLVKNFPTSWEDLLNDEYANSVVIANPQTSGSGMNMVLAVAYALGGDITKLDTAFDYFAKMKDKGNLSDISWSISAFQKGEIPIYICYDFLARSFQKTCENEINSEVVFPKEGSIWAPSALVINKWAPYPDLAKKFADFLTSDKGQLLLAEGGATPIRYVEGNLKIPDDIKKNMLPEDLYKNCGKPDQWNSVNPEDIVDGWTNIVLN